MSELLYTPVRFEDVDQFSEWEMELGWEVESTQLSRGEIQLGFDHVVTPDLFVGQFCTKGAMHNTVAFPEGMTVFMIPRTNRRFVWCGNDLPPTLLAIGRSSHGEGWAVIPDGWDCYEFMVPDELIRRTEIIPPAFFETTTRQENAFVPLAQRATDQFLSRMDLFFHRLRQANNPIDEAVREEVFLDGVIDGLQKLFDAGLNARGLLPRATRRADLFKKARDLMRSQLETELSADQIAQMLGVSYRVLNYAFQEAVGVSPYQYFLTEKLHAARRRLKSTNKGILETCTTYGFSNTSRFAQQYKRLFGELPSQTVESTRNSRCRARVLGPGR